MTTLLFLIINQNDHEFGCKPFYFPMFPYGLSPIIKVFCFYHNNDVLCMSFDIITDTKKKIIGTAKKHIIRPTKFDRH